jgi:hypothetical protein
MFPWRLPKHRQAAENGDFHPVRRLYPGDDAGQIVLQPRLLGGIDEGNRRLLIGGQGDQSQIHLLTGRQADAFHAVFNGPLLFFGIGFGIVNFNGQRPLPYCSYSERKSITRWAKVFMWDGMLTTCLL